MICLSCEWSPRRICDTHSRTDNLEDPTDLARFRWERAIEKAQRIISLYGNHWTNEKERCARFESPSRPCTCGFTDSMRELSKLVPQ